MYIFQTNKRNNHFKNTYKSNKIYIKRRQKNDESRMQDGGYVGETQEDGLMGGTASLDIGYY